MKRLSKTSLLERFNTGGGFDALLEPEVGTLASPFFFDRQRRF